MDTLAVSDESDEEEAMTPEERYRRDTQFKMLVDLLEAQIYRANYTPTELREAAMLAAIHYDTINMRRSYLLPEEKLP